MSQKHLVAGEKTKVHLLSFYTEGQPFDIGPNLAGPAGRFERAATENFDGVQFWTPRKLLALDSSWQESLRDYSPEIQADPRFSAGTKWNPGWARMGLFAWKPRLILEACQSEGVQPGDILFYHDSDCEKYPDYLHRVGSWRRWLKSNLIEREILVFRDNRARLIHDTKPEIWEKFFTQEEALRLPHIWAGAFAIKVGERSLNFVKSWQELCSDKENLFPFSRGDSDPTFSKHAPDQAILACLWHHAKALDPILGSEIFLHGSRKIPPPSRFKRLMLSGSRRIRRITSR